MAKLFSMLFLIGLLFLLTIITGLLPLGQPPMVAGQGVLYDAVASTGAANLVTAVVLGYRGIDTLGELSILFAAAAAGSLAFAGLQTKSTAHLPKPSFILETATGLLLPLLLVTGLYIVLHGHLTPGGGFQGGVLLATAIFLPSLVRGRSMLNHQVLSLLEGLAGASFIIIGLLALYANGSFLQPLLDKGQFATLFSAGSLPLLYIAVGLKVGAELAGLLTTLAGNDDEESDYVA